MKKINLPNLTTIDGDNVNGFFYKANNPDLIYYFPKLRIIKGYNTIRPDLAPFSNVVNVVIPETVISTTKCICSANETITLNCNKATFDSKWCGTTPTVNFTMCDNWQASINIAVAAKNHTKDWFIDLFQNKLYDHSITTDTGDGGMIVSAGEITIPLAIFNALTDDELAIAENKNWTVGGA